MASRSHVDVNERRLRPIYDCLDNGNNKKAIQEADKVLKKQRDLQCAKVLKALALLRLGRHDESSVILQEVHSQHPTEEATLQAMAICYREVHKLELIADMYENAHKFRQDNEEILSALFMSYVRLGDYKKQQRTAMILHRLKPQKNPYYFWAIMSIVMQAHDAQDSKLAHGMFLPLAERMAQKYVKEEKIEAEAEVQLYLIILESLEKWEAALELLEGPLGDRFVSELHFRETKSAELYIKLQRWSRANLAYKNLLKDNPDHWLYWQEYIRSMIQLKSQQTEEAPDSDNNLDNTEEKVLAFIKGCRKETEEGRPLRGPYLAQLELIRQCQLSANEKCRNLGDPVELIVNYFRLFGDKFCCFSDLKSFFEILTEEENEKLLSSLEESVNLPTEEGSIGYAENVKQMQRHITVLQMRRYLGFHEKLSTEEKVNTAKELLDRHQNGLKFGEDLLSTDLQYSDPYLLMAVYLLIDAWQDTGNQRSVWQIIVQLEKGLLHSPSSFQVKLLLIRLYGMLGAFGPCPVLYDGMEIKHIMNDTVGHIVSNHVGRLGHFMAACAMYGTMLRFFTVNHKETTEYLIASYKYGSFTKIQEFVKFRARLQKSLQHASATAERMLLDLVLETNSHLSTEQMVMYMEIDPEKDKTDFDELCDNRDLTVLTSWDPPSRCCMKEVKEKSFQEEKAWLKIRNLMLRILAAAVMLGREMEPEHHANNGVANDSAKKPMHEILQDLRSQLGTHLDMCEKCWNEEQKYPIQGPYRTRLCTYLRSSHHKMFLGMVDNVIYIHSLQEEGMDKVDNEKEEKMKSDVADLLASMVSKHRCKLLSEQEDKHSINVHVMEDLVLCAETLAQVTVLAGVCHRILKPVKTALARKNKKKKDGAIPIPCTFATFNSMVTGVEKAGHDLHNAVLDLDPVFLQVDLSALNLSDPLQECQVDAEIEREMWKKVERSYQQSAAEVQDFLHKKLQYLSTLQL